MLIFSFLVEVYPVTVVTLSQEIPPRKGA